MPWSPAKPCARPGCGALTRERFCAPHAAAHEATERARRGAADARRPSAAARGYGTDWKALRKQILARDPMCRTCRVKPSKHADHIVPRRAGGSDDPSNLQGVCHGCHSAKTAASDGGFGNPTQRGAQLRAAAARRHPSPPPRSLP